MISYAVKALDGNPIMSSMVLIGAVYALSIAPQFTRDAYLKLLPIFLIPAAMIASSDSVGFAMNVELMLGAGILVAGYIKVLDMFDRTKKLLKDPQEDKFMSSLIYISIYAVFFISYVGIGKAGGIQLHKPIPQAKSPFYFMLLLIYLVTVLASITGFKLGFGDKTKVTKSKKVENEPAPPPADDTTPPADDTTPPEDGKSGYCFKFKP